MYSALDGINWLAILACVIAGQLLLTVWFAAIFPRPWARAYGVDDPKQHTREIPPYTYALGALCVFLLSVGTAALQGALGIDGVGPALALGLGIALHFSLATALPGYAFLKRWNAFILAMGSQIALILVVSVILGAL